VIRTVASKNVKTKKNYYKNTSAYNPSVKYKQVHPIAFATWYHPINNVRLCDSDVTSTNHDQHLVLHVSHYRVGQKTRPLCFMACNLEVLVRSAPILAQTNDITCLTLPRKMG